MTVPGPAAGLVLGPVLALDPEQGAEGVGVGGLLLLCFWVNVSR